MVKTYKMKTIIVEGCTDEIIISTLFEDILIGKVEIRVAMGFSNAISIAKTLIDFHQKVLLVMDTDSDRSIYDNRTIFNRLNTGRFPSRYGKVIWMDPCVDSILSQIIPDIKGKGRKINDVIKNNKEKILQIKEFQEIRKFIG